MDLSNMKNFKGVMLCNRPSQGPPQSTGASESESSKPTFISTVTPEDQLGLNPVKHERVAAVVKDKNKQDDVTWRHKKWLAEFQQRKNEISDMMEEKTHEVLEAKARFADRAAQQRQAIRMARDVNPEDEELLTAAMAGTMDAAAIQEAAERYEAAQPVSEQVQQVPQKLSEKNLQKHAAKAKKSKPKWALTEEQNEEVEELEMDDLLDFAENLDYEQYIDDMEVQEALTFVKNRVTDLANGEPKELEEGGEDAEGEGGATEGEETAGQGIPRARAKWQKKENNWETGSQASNMSVGSNVSEKSILEDGRMKGVHSSASVRAMMAKEANKLGNIDEGLDLAVAPPTIATAPSRTSNAGKTDASNLPFLYRHPAV